MSIKTTTTAEIPDKQETSSEFISIKVMSELKTEIDEMLTYAIKNGVIINTDINLLIQKNTQGDLLDAYNLLVKNISPVTPKSINFMKELHEEEEGKSFMHRLPLLRNLVLLTLFFLILFIVTGMSANVNNDSLDKGVMNNNGLNLLLNLGFLAAVSGLGVLFFLLKRVSLSIKEGTLIPEESIFYATQIVLGIVAGLIVSEIISFYEINPEKINLFNKSILALIGGFSSDSIFSILEGIINRVKSIFITK